ncbi:MAG: hypothetical protein HND58_16435 [Planctomycetota bacterium]|nr:MAG: hypothetical protein HND58_16435 [Planctomycetota bacterium]
MAAAQTPHDWLRIDRLAIGLPTFGDWSWRLEDPERMAFGSGAELRALLRSLGPDAAAEARETLRLCDAAVHAKKVRAATLCKLALRDEVVPAPSAAAVFNAARHRPRVQVAVHRASGPHRALAGAGAAAGDLRAVCGRLPRSGAGARGGDGGVGRAARRG